MAVWASVIFLSLWVCQKAKEPVLRHYKLAGCLNSSIKLRTLQELTSLHMQHFAATCLRSYLLPEYQYQKVHPSRNPKHPQIFLAEMHRLHMNACSVTAFLNYPVSHTRLPQLARFPTPQKGWGWRSPWDVKVRQTRVSQWPETTNFTLEMQC